MRKEALQQIGIIIIYSEGFSRSFCRIDAPKKGKISPDIDLKVSRYESIHETECC